jgi:copper chaperone CopZ
MDISTHTDLGLTAQRSGGGCGPGCTCGSASEGSHHGAESHGAHASNGATHVSSADAASLVSAEYAVTGMTCGHCVASVTEEISELDGVTGVSVDLVASGISTVTVDSARALDPAAVRAAIEEAGYALASDAR